MATDQKVVSVQSQKVEAAEEEDVESDDQLRDTKGAFYEYLFSKSARDAQLSRTETETFREVRQELESDEDSLGSGEAAEMGRRLAAIGECVCHCVEHLKWGRGPPRGGVRYLEHIDILYIPTHEPPTLDSFCTLVVSGRIRNGSLSKADSNCLQGPRKSCRAG